jgi:uncharacterized protein (DUF1501 family)
MIKISRRRFLTLSSGLLVAGCTSDPRSSLTSLAPTPGSTPETTGPATTTTLPSVVTTIAAPPDMVLDDRVLVMVELAGGNDAVNTLPPLTGLYRDLRPTLALSEADLITSSALPDHGLHPSLGPLTPMLDAGRVAVLAGIGFADPDRSHFVSTDRWMRADRMNEQVGWLGRWLDQLPADPTALGATALGSNGRMLLGSDRHGTVIDGVDAFAFPPELGNASIRALTEPIADDPLLAAAQRAYLASVGAIEEFDTIADAVRARLPDPDESEITSSRGTFSTGLAVAAQLLIGDVGTRVVTVKGGGFDTHSAQLGVHADLLADLADGLSSFWQVIDEAGMSDRVLVVTHSEFGRRVVENASAGCDHGAGGISFVMGNTVQSGLHGSIDLDDLVEGDLRPTIDPGTVFTACLDWLGADVEAILGARSDELSLFA